MENDKTNRLLFRQLQDIQVQAEKILSRDSSSEQIENFAKYSAELKSYIASNLTSPKIISLLEEIPDISYKRAEKKLWQYIVLPNTIYSIYKDYKIRKQIIEEINIARSKYATLEFHIRGM